MELVVHLPFTILEFMYGSEFRTAKFCLKWLETLHHSKLFSRYIFGCFLVAPLSCTISYEISGQWRKSLNSCVPMVLQGSVTVMRMKGSAAWKGLRLRRGGKQSDDCPKATNNARGLVWRRMSMTNLYVPCPNIIFMVKNTGMILCLHFTLFLGQTPLFSGLYP